LTNPDLGFFINLDPDPRFFTTPDQDPGFLINPDPDLTKRSKLLQLKCNMYIFEASVEVFKATGEAISP
jgi:hypothetical protein